MRMTISNAQYFLLTAATCHLDINMGIATNKVTTSLIGPLRLRQFHVLRTLKTACTKPCVRKARLEGEILKNSSRSPRTIFYAWDVTHTTPTPHPKNNTSLTKGREPTSRRSSAQRRNGPFQPVPIHSPIRFLTTHVAYGLRITGSDVYPISDAVENPSACTASSGTKLKTTSHKSAYELPVASISACHTRSRALAVDGPSASFFSYEPCFSALDPIPPPRQSKSAVLIEKISLATNRQTNPLPPTCASPGGNHRLSFTQRLAFSTGQLISCHPPNPAALHYAG